MKSVLDLKNIAQFQWNYVTYFGWKRNSREYKNKNLRQVHNQEKANVGTIFAPSPQAKQENYSYRVFPAPVSTLKINIHFLWLPDMRGRLGAYFQAKITTRRHTSVEYLSSKKTDPAGPFWINSDTPNRRLTLSHLPFDSDTWFLENNDSESAFDSDSKNTIFPTILTYRLNSLNK